MRFADEHSAATFPLEVEGTVNWSARDNAQHCEIPLPEVPPEHILVPSFMQLDTDAPFQFTLENRQTHQRWSLPGIPEGNQHGDHADVSMHIDYWQSEQALESPTVHLKVAQPEAPRSYLLTLSVRPLKLDVPPQDGYHSPAHVTRTLNPISQMLAEDGLRQRICSPTSLAMVLGAKGRDALWSRLVSACFDARSNLYGVWPLAISAAASEGALASVETVCSWEPVRALLEHDVAIVASIRFGPGELPGSPMPSTGGHLVVVTGVDEEGVHVLDPAAERDEDVLRRYDLAAFSRAWFAYRGAAYIVQV